MSTYSNRLQLALQNVLQRVVKFFHPRSSCTTHMSADVQRITLNASSCHNDLGWNNQTTRYNCRFSATSLALTVIFSVS